MNEILDKKKDKDTIIKEQELLIEAYKDEYANLEKEKYNPGIKSIITSISSSTCEVAASINEMTATSKNTSEMANDLATIAREGNLISKKSILSNKDISMRYSIISEVINFITGIAIDTHYLSINAKIQAAHAGEFGKGFSVIADEITNLSLKTSEHAKNILKIIKSMKDIVKEGVIMAEKTEQYFEKVTQIAEQNNISAIETKIAMQEINIATTTISNDLIKITENLI
jgi:methyl-accepting chemotaxis protein